MRYELPRALRTALGMSFVLLVVGTTVVILNYGQGYYESGYHVSAVFPASSQGIFTDGGTAVKMRGIDIGSVSGIELLEDGTARVTMFLDEGVEVPEAAMASIEPLSVFGPKFIRIDPGETELTGPFLADGGVIARTAKAPELTEILAGATELFEHIDPHEVVAIFDAVSEGVTGLGPELGRTIDSASPLLDVGASHTADLERFLDDAASLASVAASRSGQMVAIVENLRTLTPVLVEHADDFDALLAATTSISTDFAQLLEDNPEAITAFVTGTGRFVDGVYLHADAVPIFIDFLATFFGRLSDVIRMPAPEGTRAAALRGFISLEPCLILGVCSSGAATAAAAGTRPPDPLVSLTRTLVGS